VILFLRAGRAVLRQASRAVHVHLSHRVLDLFMHFAAFCTVDRSQYSELAPSIRRPARALAGPSWQVILGPVGGQFVSGVECRKGFGQ